MADYAASVRAAIAEATAGLDMQTLAGSPDQMVAAALMAHVADVIAHFAIPLENDDEDMDDDARGLALLVALERHGAGLRPCTQSGPFSVGDVVIGSARTMWVVEATSGAGDARAMLGGAAQKNETLAAMWRPLSEARRWLDPGQAAAPGLNDPDAALSHLVGLWGQSESKDRDLSTPAALFWELAGAPGVKIDRKGIAEDDDAKAVKAWLVAHGAVAAATAVPGDLVWRGDTGNAAIVLRAENGVADLLTMEKGPAPLGEAKGALRIARARPFGADDLIWRPG